MDPHPVLNDLQLWDAAADNYAAADVGSFFRRFSPFLQRTLGDVTGKRLLDLGCGHGWLAGRLHAAGATVTGIDGSTALLRHAEAAHPDVTFEAHDLTAGLPRPPQTYDGIVAHMVLMDVPELESLIRDVRASLAEGGVFVFSILHPCFFGQTPVQEADGERYRRVTGYLEHERRWITTFGGHHHYHRPLSWYFALLTRHGLVIDGLHEPPTLPAHQEPSDRWTEHERWFATIPTMLAISCRAGSPPSYPQG